MLPKQYEWLISEPGPKMLLEALKLFGTIETAGRGDNPIIIGWADEIGKEAIYSHDEVPWCGLFMAVIANRAGKRFPDNPLWALDWSDFGVPAIDGAKLGDVIVFRREGGGHVSLYVGEDNTSYHVLGGNQSDKVCITRILKARMHAIRRPIYKNIPENVRKVILSDTGELSTNEK